MARYPLDVVRAVQEQVRQANATLNQLTQQRAATPDQVAPEAWWMAWSDAVQAGGNPGDVRIAVDWPLHRQTPVSPWLVAVQADDVAWLQTLASHAPPTGHDYHQGIEWSLRWNRPQAGSWWQSLPNQATPAWFARQLHHAAGKDWAWGAMHAKSGLGFHSKAAEVALNQGEWGYFLDMAVADASEKGRQDERWKMVLNKGKSPGNIPIDDPRWQNWWNPLFESDPDRRWEVITEAWSNTTVDMVKWLAPQLRPDERERWLEYAAHHHCAHRLAWWPQGLLDTDPPPDDATEAYTLLPHPASWLEWWACESPGEVGRHLPAIATHWGGDEAQVMGQRDRLWHLAYAMPHERDYETPLIQSLCQSDLPLPRDWLRQPPPRPQHVTARVWEQALSRHASALLAQTLPESQAGTPSRGPRL